MEGPPLDRDEFERWSAGAERAMQGARLQRDGELHNWACFLAEQAAQLAVKGLLHGIGAAPWGHDLRGLIEATVEAGTGLDAGLLDPAVRLTRHYIPARYPDAHPAGDAGANYRRADADTAIADAGEIIAAVAAAWRELGDA